MRGSIWVIPAIMMLWFSVDATATTFVTMDTPALVRQSDAIVLGRVTDLRSAANGRRLSTQITIEVEECLKGGLPVGPLILREPGGRVGDREVFIQGAALYSRGERVLVHLQRSRDGSFRTSFLAMGKFRVLWDRVAGHELAIRDYGDAKVYDSGLVEAASQEAHPLDELLSQIRRLVENGSGDSDSPTSVQVAPTQAEPSEEEPTPSVVFEEFTTVSTKRRWFEADSGTPVAIKIHSTGDPDLGDAASEQAVLDAFAIWSGVASATIELVDGGPVSPSGDPNAGTIAGGVCDDLNHAFFADPYDEVPDPDPNFPCSGVVGIGGGCSNPFSMKVINGVTFTEQTEGDLVMADGFAPGCSFKVACNYTEVATHEIGHLLGLGHSSQTFPEPDPLLEDATMYFLAHFDGRCADIRQDDIDGLSFIYPLCADAFGDSDGDGICDDGDKSGDPNDNPCLCPGAAGCAEDCDDNCRHRANPAQLDSGGLGSGSAADGIGDKCQCGDVSGNGVITSGDGTIIKRDSIGLPPGLTESGNCDVNDNGSCTSGDGTIVKRATIGLPPGIQQKCTNALPAPAAQLQ